MKQNNSYTFEGQLQVRAAIEKYLTDYGMTSTRKVAAYVAGETGMNISASTVSRLVRKFGYIRKAVQRNKIEQGLEWVRK